MPADNSVFVNYSKKYPLVNHAVILELKDTIDRDFNDNPNVLRRKFNTTLNQDNNSVIPLSDDAVKQKALDAAVKKYLQNSIHENHFKKGGRRKSRTHKRTLRKHKRRTHRR